MLCDVRLERFRQVAPVDVPRLQTLTEAASPLRWIIGDNLAALHALSVELGPQVSLAYLDPPFFTGRVHQRVARKRHPDRSVERTESPAFDDRWVTLSDYLQSLAERLEVTWRLLAPHGSIVVHVDPKTSHYVKVLCDELFGFEHFASEIIWRYRRWPAKTRNFQRVHDVLLRYVKEPGAAVRFNQLYEPLAASTRATWGDRKQHAVVGSKGRRTRSSTLEEASPGTPLGDVWEIGIVAPIARERTGYPTQKPEALLERLIQALSEPDDLVLDPYAGSGTTLAVARRCQRRAIGIDASAEAWLVSQPRLSSAGPIFVQRVDRTPSMRTP
jgi:site-specific DNA-methyltransferase (adenine-specific)